MCSRSIFELFEKQILLQNEWDKFKWENGKSDQFKVCQSKEEFFFFEDKMNNEFKTEKWNYAMKLKWEKLILANGISFLGFNSFKINQNVVFEGNEKSCFEPMKCYAVDVFLFIY